MIPQIHEVTESEAQGKIKAVYEDINSTFGTLSVPLVFRQLATCPDYLEVAWRMLKPNAQTVFFETSADEVRRRATAGAVYLAPAPAPPHPGDVGPVLDLFDRANARLFLAVATLRSGTNGQQPRLTELPQEAKRRAAPPSRHELQAIQLIDRAEASEALQAVFEDMRDTLAAPGIDDTYRALACWPDYLVSAWQAWKPVLERPEYQALQRELYRMTEETVTALPFRMEIYPHALRNAGLSEQQIDDVRAALQAAYRAAPGLVAHAAYLESYEP